MHVRVVSARFVIAARPRARPPRSATHEPFAAIPGRQPRWVDSAEDAVADIKSGQSVFLHTAAATPRALVKALAEHGVKNSLRDIKLLHIHTETEPYFLQNGADKVFQDISFFTGANVRGAIAEGRAQYAPCFLRCARARAGRARACERVLLRPLAAAPGRGPG